MTGPDARRRLRVYLAGPDVFLPDAVALGDAKKRLCAEHGFEGVFPLDSPTDHLDDLPGQEAGLGVFDLCVELMDGCDLAIANMTPFRGPSMDVGTAVEVGYMFAQGKPVFGYTDSSAGYADRVTVDGFHIEPFGLCENLMAPGAVARSTGALPVQAAHGYEPRIDELDAFVECLRAVRDHPTIGRR